MQNKELNQPRFATKIFGILNLTEDSFSDGGKFLQKESGIQEGLRLFQEGADFLDIGAQASNIHAKAVTAEEEWNRIASVLPSFQEKRIPISLDSYRPSVWEKGIQAGVDCLNDIRGFTDPMGREVLQTFKDRLPQLVVMHSHNQGEFAKIESHLNPATVVSEVLKFLNQQKNQLSRLGIPEEKMIFDPGMGFFLGKDPEISFTVLRNLSFLKQELGQILISVSRKSFIGAVLGNRPATERGAGTLAVETLLMNEGVDCIRTHDVGSASDARQIVQYFRSSTL